MKFSSIMICLIVGILSINGCCKKEICPPPMRIDCPAPERPELKAATKYDRQIFFQNFTSILEYAELLEQQNQCYTTALGR